MTEDEARPEARRRSSLPGTQGRADPSARPGRVDHMAGPHDLPLAAEAKTVVGDDDFLHRKAFAQIDALLRRPPSEKGIDVGAQPMAIGQVVLGTCRDQ